MLHWLKLRILIELEENISILQTSHKTIHYICLWKKEFQPTEIMLMSLNRQNTVTELIYLVFLWLFSFDVYAALGIHSHLDFRQW